MKNKFFATLLTAGLTASMIAGLGVAVQADDLYEGDPITVRMMVWGNAEDYTKPNEALFNRFPEIAEKVNVEVELGGGGDADVAEKLRLMLASGEELPDLIRLNYTQFPEYADAGILYDLTDAIAPYEDDIMDAAKDIMKWDDTYYAVIHEIKPKVWFYRTDMFEEAGIDPAEITTVDEFIEAGRKFHEVFPDSYIENYGTPLSEYDIMMMMEAVDGTFCDEDGNYHMATDEGVRKAFEILKKLHDADDAFSTDIVEWTADWQADFANDVLASQLIGGWMKDHLMNWTPENAGKWAMATWPEEIRPGSEAGGGIWVVPKNAPHAELAADMIAKFAFDPDVRKDVYEVAGKIPPLKSAAEDEFYTTSPYFGDTSAYFEAMETFRVYPYNPSSTREKTIANQYLTEYLSGTMDLDAALAAADADLENQIGNPYD
ncbi:MAG: extracellular solute-binding protein [Blautia sp.]|nr:extracellular solute-binding protein [Blautia sp.]